VKEMPQSERSKLEKIAHKAAHRATLKNKPSKKKKGKK